MLCHTQELGLSKHVRQTRKWFGGNEYVVLCRGALNLTFDCDGALHGLFAGFARANPDGFVQANDEDFAIADLTSSARPA